MIAGIYVTRAAIGPFGLTGIPRGVIYPAMLSNMTANERTPKDNATTADWSSHAPHSRERIAEHRVIGGEALVI